MKTQNSADVIGALGRDAQNDRPATGSTITSFSTATAARSPVRIHRFPIIAIFAGVLSCIAQRALAAGAGMPWEGPLNQLVASLTGPVAKGIGVAAIVISALGMAIAESGHFMKKALTVVFALSIVFSATSLVAMFFGFSGGLAL